MNDELWNDTVTAERARLYARRNPDPPMRPWQVIVVALLGMVGCGAIWLWLTAVL